MMRLTVYSGSSFSRGLVNVGGINVIGAALACICLVFFLGVRATTQSGGSMAATRAYLTATLLGDGHVLVVGGDGIGAPSTAELYDPASGTFAPTGGLSM